jgi:hypothetical protein
MTKTLEIFNGDAIIGRSTGRLKTVVDKPKARQHMKRLLELNKPHGAGIDEHVGTVPETEFELSANVQRDIIDAFDQLVQDYATFQLADRTAEERLVSLASIFVVPAIFDKPSKTGYAVRVDALTAAGRNNAVAQTGVLVTPQGG